MSTDRKIVALLPIKDNSQRVPGKNFRDIAGKPLYRWILNTLLALEEVDSVVINTDSHRLLDNPELESEDKIMARRRVPDLCGDEVSMNRILADDIEAVEADMYLMTHATNPLLSRESIRDAIDSFTSNGKCDSLFSVNRFQTRFYGEDGRPINHDPENLVQTQDLEPWYEENSCLYLFTRESFAATGARIGLSPMMYETPRIESVDIDDPEDWLIAEALLEQTRWGVS